MATTKKTTTAKTKPAAKKPAAKSAVAAKKPAATAKKPAVKKPAPKAAAVKKPAAKKPAVKKPAAAPKKPAVKKPAPKAAAVKKPAAKKAAAVKKPVAKKPAVPAKKPAAEKKKPVVKKPAVKKPSVTTVEEILDPKVKFRNLFDAFSQGKLPFANGYIVSSFFSENTAYAVYEIVSYAGVKEIFLTETGLQFITGGKKLFVLVEHDTYEKKFQDPVSRIQGESIPKRFAELETIIAKNQTRIMIAKEPNEIFGSFTILKPSSINFSVIFYELPDVYASLANFFQESLNRHRKIPQPDAKKASQLISSIVERYMGFQGEFI